MEVLRVKDILNQMDREALLYVRYVTEKSHVLLTSTMMEYCTDELLNMPIGRLDAGDYELKGHGIGGGFKNAYKGKVLICTAYREKE